MKKSVVTVAAFAVRAVIAGDDGMFPPVRAVVRRLHKAGNV